MLLYILQCLLFWVELSFSAAVPGNFLSHSVSLFLALSLYFYACGVCVSMICLNDKKKNVFFFIQNEAQSDNMLEYVKCEYSRG